MAKKNKSNVNPDINFFQEAREFSKTILTEDVEEKFITYATQKGWSRNEMQLFRYMLNATIDMNFCCAILNCDNN